MFLAHNAYNSSGLDEPLCHRQANISRAPGALNKQRNKALYRTRRLLDWKVEETHCVPTVFDAMVLSEIAFHFSKRPLII